MYNEVDIWPDNIGWNINFNHRSNMIIINSYLNTFSNIFKKLLI